MLKPERFDKIVHLVGERGIVTVDELCKSLNASKATVRRDLLELDEAKMLTRTHGGAIAVNKSLTEEVPIYLRTHMRKEEKERIAAVAVGLINDGETIYIGAGTTARALARHLVDFHRLTVLTNDIEVASVVARTDNSLIVVGGELKKSSFTLLGIFAESVLSELHVDSSFMAVDAVDLKNGFMDFGMDEVSVKRIVIKNSKKNVMMCDSSKFKNSAFISICPISGADVVITNSDLEQEKVNTIQNEGVKVICV